MPVTDDVFTFLAEQGLAGGSTDWTLLRRRIMDDPAEDQLVVVAEDGGPTPEIGSTSGIGDSALSDPGVLVTVRGNAWDGDTSLEKANDIHAALHGLLNVSLVSGGDLYLRVRAQTPEPVFAGYDEQGRPQHTIAFRFLRFINVST